MADIQSVLTENRTAVATFLAAARAVPPETWNQARSPGKWSPRQLAEHVALAYEVSTAALKGKFPASVPRLLRPLIRTLFLNPVLRNGRFGRAAKAPGPFRPSDTPAPATTLLPRLQRAADTLEAELAAELAQGRETFEHPFFGRVALLDYLRLQAIHTHHHRRQFPGADAA